MGQLKMVYEAQEEFMLNHYKVMKGVKFHATLVCEGKKVSGVELYTHPNRVIR